MSMAEGGYVGPTTGSNPEEMGQRSDSELSEEEPHLLTVAWLPSMTWGCPRMGVPQARWMGLFHGKSHQKMDDLEVPP